MYERAHHRRIARVLNALDAALLERHQCLFGGGTAIALRFGEYRESIDMDFLVSNQTGYRDIRHLLSNAQTVNALLASGEGSLNQLSELRIDQYGIRTRIEVEGYPIKFEIVYEARIDLQMPRAKDRICGISALTALDMVASKLLANADRWADDSVFNRDLIDLAMMQAPLPLLREAIGKTEPVYGQAIRESLSMAIDKIKNKPDWLERCMQVMAIHIPKSLLWQRIRAVRRVLP